MSWELKSLENVCSLITDGAHWSPIDIGVGFPMPSVKDMTDNGFDYTNCKKISESDFLKLKNSNCSPILGDVLIAKDGSYLKHCFSFKGEEEIAILSSIAIFRPNLSIIDSIFLEYLFKSPEIKSLATGYVSGVAVPRIVLKDFKKIQLPIPPLQTQKRIASILSAYDDLIETNLKRIKLLEETAQSIYKEWFVNFRFPNFENTPINQETGLPKGWEVKKVEELNKKITDGTHDSPKPTDYGFHLITGKNLLNGFVDFSNSYFISQEDHQKIKSRSYLDLGDILYSNIGTVGSTAIVFENFEYSCKNVIIFKPLPEHTNFLYCFLTNDLNKKLFLQGLLGSNQKFISLKYARDYKVLFPPTFLITNFNKTTKAIFDNKRCLFEMNQKLKEARDILLPRLMNRTIEE
jgi:type I restriction enzyme S subunit